MDFDERIVTGEVLTEDHDSEVGLRPRVLDEYVGQDKVKENLKIYIEAARCSRPRASLRPSGTW